MMLANRFVAQPIAGWWIGEKFDGVRGFWDGRVIRTRAWRAVAAPAWFTQALPHGVALDGELWAGNGTFQTVSKLARFGHPDAADWREVKLKVFDWPTTDEVAFEERHARLAAFENAVVQRVAIRRCAGADDARAELAAVVRRGGEGCMVKRPGHFYEFGRSNAWLKVKPEGID
jgi:DNA ligase-1